jgi:hypothetical protein
MASSSRCCSPSNEIATSYKADENWSSNDEHRESVAEGPVLWRLYSVVILSEALDFFVGLVEVAAVVASILVVGLMVATVAFWILSRSLSTLGGRPAGSDWYEDEMDGCIDVKAIVILADDASASPDSTKP